MCSSEWNTLKGTSHVSINSNTLFYGNKKQINKKEMSSIYIRIVFNIMKDLLYNMAEHFQYKAMGNI